MSPAHDPRWRREAAGSTLSGALEVPKLLLLLRCHEAGRFGGFVGVCGGRVLNRK
jgi:hypothetical protein